MADFRAFCGMRPVAGRASQVAAVPYDVVNSEEAALLAAGNRTVFCMYPSGDRHGAGGGSAR